MKHVCICLIALLPFAAAAEDLKTTLTHQTQQMLDAVTAGDAKVWDKYLAPGAIYVDENGAVIPRAEMLKQVTPPPKGISGAIKANTVAFHQSGNVAVLVHRDDEIEGFFGQTLHAEYLSMDTWQKTAAGWRLLGQQVLATQKEPPSIALARAKLDEYAGAFNLKGGTVAYTVTRRGAKLMGARDGKPAAQLLAEAPDVFFIHGQPRIRKIFVREAGRITGFVDRREGRDVVWLKRP